MNVLYWILWPAFMIAALSTGLLILTIDPQALELGGRPVAWSNIGAYSIGFLAAWTLAAASSLTTCILQRDGDAINRSASPADRRAGRTRGLPR